MAEKPERAKFSAQKVCFPARDEVKYGYRSAVENGAQKGAPFCFSGNAGETKETCFSGNAGESACLHHLEAGPQNL
ncbi:MAG: hypothetical protein ACLRPX_00960 [Ruthenibacterium sp.]